MSFPIIIPQALISITSALEESSVSGVNETHDASKSRQSFHTVTIASLFLDKIRLFPTTHVVNPEVLSSARRICPS